MTEAANAFLDSHPGWAVLTTIDRDGYPHSVPLGYHRSGDHVLLNARAGSQRLANVKRNPKVCVMVEAGEAMADLKGLVLRGDAEIVSAEAAVLELMREGARQRGTAEGELPTEVRPDTTYIRVTPHSIVSWGL